MLKVCEKSAIHCLRNAMREFSKFRSRESTLEKMENFQIKQKKSSQETKHQTFLRL